MHAMNHAITRTLALAISMCLLCSNARADHHSPSFKKIKLTGEFFSEGCTSADYNKDSSLDFAAGPYWYEGPDFQKRHTFYEGKPVDPKGYSANFLAFSHDFNNDAWPDIFVVGFPGQESA